MTSPAPAAEPAEDAAPAAPSILVPVLSAEALEQAAPLLRLLARAREAQLVVLALHRSAVDDGEGKPQEPELESALGEAGLEARVVTRTGHNLQGMIREATRELEPDLLVLLWRPRRRRALVRDEIELRDLLLDVPCDVVVLAMRPGESVGRPRRLLFAPLGLSPGLAGELAAALAHAADAPVRALASDDEEVERLREWADGALDGARMQVHRGAGRSAAREALQETSPEEGDLLVVPSANGGVLHRLALGSDVERIARRSVVPVLIAKPRPRAATTLLRRGVDMLFGVIPPLDEERKAEVYRDIRRSSRPGVDFHVLIALAAAIATFGLLLDNAAVVIGGMLVAPLMSPLVGLGLGVVHGDARLLRLAVLSTFRGSLLVVLVAVVIAALAPERDPTSQVTSRMQPSLLDLGVALAAGAAAAYSIGREQLSPALPGVAIAAALVPPLGAVGVGLVLGDTSIAVGSSLLFAANLVSISAAAGLAFLWLGFRPEPEHAPRLQLFGRGFTALAVLLVAVAVPLGVLGAGYEVSDLERDVERALDEVTLGGEPLRWRSFDVEERPDAEPRLVVTVESPSDVTPDEVAALERDIEDGAGHDIALVLRVVRTTDVAAGEASPDTEP